MLFLDWYINMQKPDIVAFTTATVMRHDDVIIVVHKSTMSVQKQRHDSQCNKYAKICLKRFGGNCPVQHVAQSRGTLCY